ncbi:MAG: hypothetical protein ACOCXP_00585 [Candidatus Dojkabacteria bacterium]
MDKDRGAQPATNAVLSAGPAVASDGRQKTSSDEVQVSEGRLNNPPAPAPLPLPENKTDLPEGPKFFGYKPPKWAKDYDYVRSRKGKGKIGDGDTWLLFTVDRLLKKHSV